ncbi:hypothetical protein ZBT109_0911 [Zymobacter palmae]|uniref:Uncharacterized protein n=1 Tax=Zymobacter palmae TaxID=33074 RepID=A0A348HDI2_9GAMM|nr:hypothetical protein ZBT109_0911 [Zymobacter palmae]
MAQRDRQQASEKETGPPALSRTLPTVWMCYIALSHQ